MCNNWDGDDSLGQLMKKTGKEMGGQRLIMSVPRGRHQAEHINQQPQTSPRGQGTPCNETAWRHERMSNWKMAPQSLGSPC